MPDDRFLHRRLGHSGKVSALSDFEFRVWIQYQLSADDCGVLRCSALTFQADNDALARVPLRKVQAAIERLITVGLVAVFEHQEQRYLCQTDWQNFQRVRFPRPTVHPRPSQDVLSACTPETRALLLSRHGACSERARSDDGEVSELSPSDHGHTRAREEANGLRLTANGKRPDAHTGGGAMTGGLPRDHVAHAACDDTFSRCIPSVVHAKLVNKLAPKYAGDRAATGDALKAWYRDVWSSLPADFVITGDDFKFWQGRFDAKFASTEPAPPRPEERRTAVPGVEATQEYLRRMREGIA